MRNGTSLCLPESIIAKKYGVILLVSGGLSLFTSDDEIHRVFERVMAHLEPGGRFIYEFEHLTPTRGDSNDSGWTGDWINGPDDTVMAWRNRNKYDAAARVWERLFVGFNAEVGKERGT